MSDCIENGIFKQFLERLTQLTGEKPRLLTSVPEAIQDTSQIEISAKTTPRFKSPSKEKKGVGYTTGNGSLWNVQEYLDLKEATNAQIANIINIFANSINKLSHDEESGVVTGEPDLVARVKSLILESSLLPILEAAMRSGSLLEMAKEIQLFEAYLELIKAIAKFPDLYPVL